MQPRIPDSALQRLQACRDSQTALRRRLHSLPETGWTEFLTAGTIAEQLQSLGWKLTLGSDALCCAARMGVPGEDILHSELLRAEQEGLAKTWSTVFEGGKTAVWADMHIGPPSEYAPKIVFRADMDALAIREDDRPSHRPARDGYASRHEGIMHACGHDAHMSILMGLAESLAASARDFTEPLDVRLLFQPAEEGVRGALAMVEAGALEGTDMLFGLHIGLAADSSGRLVCGVRDFLATTKLDARFFGKTAHAANRPEDGHNALLASAAAALNLHAISRHSDGATRVCAGLLRAGEQRNTIPQSADMELEVRAVTPTAHAWMENEARRVLAAAADMWNCGHDVETAGRAPAGSSDREAAALVRQCAEKMPFFSETDDSISFNASEDFTHMLEYVHAHGGKAAYMLLGSDLAGRQHTPTFDFDESVLVQASELLLRICGEAARQ